MQHRITKPSRLLDKHGELIQKGYATSLILKYQRKDVKKKLRLKEWDYYLIYNNDYGVALTVGKSPSVGLISVSFIDFNKKEETSKSAIVLFKIGELNLPESSEIGDFSYQDKHVDVSFRHEDGERKLYMKIKNCIDGADFETFLALSKAPKDSMVIATPFEECKKEFYYNQKVIGMRAKGIVWIGDKTYTFSPDNSFGILDWGRGVWPHKTTWYWSAAQGIVKDKIFGFNLGYGFGDTSAATENMVFNDGIANKLEDVYFMIPRNKLHQNEYMKPWIITSSDHRIEMNFEPIFDRNLNLSVLVLSTMQHQVFGRFTGTAVLDDGSEIYVKDFMGFAEIVVNKW